MGKGVCVQCKWFGSDSDGYFCCNRKNEIVWDRSWEYTRGYIVMKCPDVKDVNEGGKCNFWEPCSWKDKFRRLSLATQFPKRKVEEVKEVNEDTCLHCNSKNVDRVAGEVCVKEARYVRDGLTCKDCGFRWWQGGSLIEEVLRCSYCDELLDGNYVPLPNELVICSNCLRNKTRKELTEKKEELLK